MGTNTTSDNNNTNDKINDKVMIIMIMKITVTWTIMVII